MRCTSIGLEFTQILLKRTPDWFERTRDWFERTRDWFERTRTLIAVHLKSVGVSSNLVEVDSRRVRAASSCEVVPNHRTNFRPIHAMIRGQEISADVFVLVPVPTLPQRMGRVQTAGSPPNCQHRSEIRWFLTV